MSDELHDERLALAYQFRRQLAVILANGELLADEAHGPVSDEQRAAAESILTATHQPTALVSHELEADEPVIEPDGAAEAVDEPVLVDDPLEAVDEIVLGLSDREFGDSIAEQFRRTGCEVVRAHDLDELTSLASSGTTQIILDAAWPNGSLLEGVRRAAALDGDAELTLVSVVARDGLPGPMLGLDGVLSPDAKPDDVNAAVGDRSDGAARPPVVVAGADSDRLVGTLDYPVRTAEAISPTTAADAAVVFLEATALERAGVDSLAALREPGERRQPRLVLLASPPRNAGWMPVCGADVLAEKPITAVEFAAEVLLERTLENDVRA